MTEPKSLFEFKCFSKDPCLTPTGLIKSFRTREALGVHMSKQHNVKTLLSVYSAQGDEHEFKLDEPAAEEDVEFAKKFGVDVNSPDFTLVLDLRNYGFPTEEIRIAVMRQRQRRGEFEQTETIPTVWEDDDPMSIATSTRRSVRSRTSDATIMSLVRRTTISGNYFLIN